MSTTEQIEAITGNRPWVEIRFGDSPSRDALVAWVDGPDARYGFDAATEERALEGLLALVAERFPTLSNHECAA